MGLATPVRVTPLNHGLYITRLQEAKLIAGYWRVLLSLNNPTQEFEQEFSIKALTDARTRITTAAIRHMPLDRGLLENLRRRMDWLIEEATHENALLSRTRRALLDAGGWVLRGLFGVATSKDVNELREMVLEGQQQTETIKHTVNDLVTNVNLLVADINDTKTAVNKQAKVINEIEVDIVNLFEEVNNTRADVNRNQKATLLEAYVSALERRLEIRRQALEEYRLRRRDLENGKLTESVLSRLDLADTLHQAHEKGYETAPLEWYYTHCLVRPLWKDAEAVSAIVELPLLVDNIQGYHLQSFAYHHPVLGEWVSLVINEYVGYNEETGMMVVLKSCAGHNPTICHKDLAFQQGLPCERALILGVAEGVDACKIRAQAAPEARATQVALNSHVVESTDTSLEIRCQGQATRRDEKGQGSFRVLFNRAGCQVQGSSGWVLEGVEIYDTELETTERIVNTTKIEFPDIPQPNYIEPVHLEQLHQLKGVTYKKLKKLKMGHELLKFTHSTVNTYVIIGLVVAAIITVVVVVYCKYGRSQRIQRVRAACKRLRERVQEHREKIKRRRIEQREQKQVEKEIPNLGITVNELREKYLGHEVPPYLDPLEWLRRQYLSPNPLLPQPTAPDGNPPFHPGTGTTGNDPAERELSTVSV